MQPSTIFSMKLDFQTELKWNGCNYENTDEDGSIGVISLTWPSTLLTHISNAKDAQDTAMTLHEQVLAQKYVTDDVFGRFSPYFKI